MANIVDYSGDRRLQLGNEEFLRTLRFGNNWKTIRIGLRLNINAPPQTFTSGFWLGMNQGNQYGYSAPFTTCYIGAFFGDIYGAYQPFTVQGTNPSYFYLRSGNSYTYHVLKQGSSEVYTVISANNYMIANYNLQGQLQQPSQLFLDIRRYPTTTLWQIQCACTATTFMNVLVDRQTFLQNMEIDGSTPYGTGGFTGFGGIYHTGFTGNLRQPFDTLSIYWARSVPTIEFTDINVIRFE